MYFHFLSLLTIFSFLLLTICRKTDHDLLSTGMVFPHKKPILSFPFLYFFLSSFLDFRACVCVGVYVCVGVLYYYLCSAIPVLLLFIMTVSRVYFILVQHIFVA
ncbi:hypothetical protein DFP73DRAFT_290271 [Morchella snyderi]|nr:hypothetical protein DFP73DRAFT_290271 [Morchella snyderi]